MKEQLREYAKLSVTTGVNLQKGDTLIINAGIEAAELAREIATCAYDAGAKDVIIHYNDQSYQRIRLEKTSVEVLKDIPTWVIDGVVPYSKKGACFISISSQDPDAFKGLDLEKVAEYQKARQIALKEYSDNAMSNKCRWCVLSYPSKAWSKKVFPALNEDEAQSKLWELIYGASRVLELKGTEEWKKHNALIQEKKDFLNENRFKSLHFKNSKGTDLHMELPEGHIWAGGAEDDVNGIPFNANIPTEEIFSMPKRDTLNGTVASSKPLSYSGNLIDEFTLTFKDGKVVDCTAKEGLEVLKTLLASDEGASYIGEVALVPFNSPISNSNVVYFNTLFDENAACHLAFGRSYSSNIENGAELSEKELLEKGANQSIIHVDFMIGTDDLNITGINKDGKEIDIFVNGNFA